MKRLYQWVDWPGREISREGRRRDKSKFWNEGRWDNFIKPLIPKEALEFPFLEIGCNAGLYLKMAEDMGFKHVIGIDNDADRIEQASIYRKHNGGKYKLIHEKVDSDFDWNKLPRVGVILLSNTHYYFPIVDFAETITALRDRALYCIVVGNDMQKGSGYVSPRLQRMSGFFDDWTKVNTVEDVNPDGDPSPRKGMYGVLFKSNLEVWPLSNMFTEKLGSDEDHRVMLGIVTVKFYEDLEKNINIDLGTTELYRFCIETRRWSDDKSRRFLENKRQLFLDIKENGIKKLVYVNNGKFEDGLNRCAMAKALGYKNIMSRQFKTNV